MCAPFFALFLRVFLVLFSKCIYLRNGSRGRKLIKKKTDAKCTNRFTEKTKIITFKPNLYNKYSFFLKTKTHNREKNITLGAKK